MNNIFLKNVLKEKYAQKPSVSILTLSIFIVFVGNVFAQENITVQGYYPSPFGVYSKLQLVPVVAPQPIPLCAGPVDWGNIYFNGTVPANSLKLCVDDGSGGGTWNDIAGSTGSDIWERNNTTQQVYLKNVGDFVGLGTNTPEFKLTLENDGGVIARGTFGAGASLTLSGSGSKLIWYPRKSAFRVGYVVGTEWDDVNIGSYSMITGGANNQASGQYSTVSGGANNLSSGDYATVSGGTTNTASGQYSFVGGGNSNVASNQYASIAGGAGNQATGVGGVSILGGEDNMAAGIWSTIAGGWSNIAVVGSHEVAIGGGRFNTINDVYYATILGGQNNVVTTGTNAQGAVVAGGGSVGLDGAPDPTWGNQAIGFYSFVGGGQNNRATGVYSVIVGGGGTESTATSQGNRTSGVYGSTVGGGRLNNATANGSVVSGGYNNSAGSIAATVSGGANNQANGAYSTVSGGQNNRANGNYSVVSGGDSNTASGIYSVVAGGNNNVASGAYAVVPGGQGNVARGDNSWVGGNNMRSSLISARTFVWGYSAVPLLPVISQADAFFIFPNYATNVGRVGIDVVNPSVALEVNGTARFRNLSADVAGTVNLRVDPFAQGVLYQVAVSSVRYKKDIKSLVVDTEKILRLQPVKFTYKSSGREGIGLVAEDVAEQMPQLVIRDPEGRPDAVRYDKLPPYLLAVMKEIKQDNDALKAKSAELNKRLDALEKSAGLN